MSSDSRCFFQLHLPDARVVRLKLAPNCPLIHLFQHPRVGLEPSALDNITFSFGPTNRLLEPDRTPQDYCMGEGEAHVNIVFAHYKQQQQQQQQQQQRAGSPATTPVAASPIAPPQINAAAPTPRNPQLHQSSSYPQMSQSRYNTSTTSGDDAATTTADDARIRLLEQDKAQAAARHQREVEHLRQDYQNQIDALQSRITGQQTTVSSLQEKNRQLQSELMAAEQQVQSAKTEEQQETKSLLDELSQLQDAVARAEASKSEGARWRQRYEQLEKTNNALKQDFSQLQEVCRGYREQLDRRVAESSDLRSEYDALQRENEQLIQEAALGSQYAVRLAAQQDKAQERRDSHRALILDLQNQQNVLSEQLSATRAALEREVNSAAEYRNSLEMAVRDLKEARSAAQDAESRLESEIASRRAVGSQLDHEKRRRQEERDSLTKEVGELELSLRASQRNVSKLEEELRVATSKVYSPQRAGSVTSTSTAAPAAVPQQQQQWQQQQHAPQQAQQHFDLRNSASYASATPMSPQQPQFQMPQQQQHAPPQHQQQQQQSNYAQQFQQQLQQPPFASRNGSGATTPTLNSSQVPVQQQQQWPPQQQSFHNSSQAGSFRPQTPSGSARAMVF